LFQLYHNQVGNSSGSATIMILSSSIRNALTARYDIPL